MHKFAIILHSIRSCTKSQATGMLCEGGLSVFDISEFSSPLFDVPFVLDLHKPAVTSVEYLDECPDNLTSSLYSVQSKQPMKKKVRNWVRHVGSLTVYCSIVYVLCRPLLIYSNTTYTYST